MKLDVRRHNETVLGTLKVGDLVEFPRVTFSHWGVYIAPAYGVYRKSKNVSVSSNPRQTDTKENKRNFGISRMPLPIEEIKERALSSLGEAPYNLLMDNCEHFASWCRNGIPISFQVKTAVLVVKVTVGGLVGYSAITGGIVWKLLETAWSYVRHIYDSVLRNNCEHFAALCPNGITVLFEVKTALTVVGVLGTAMVVGWLAYKLYVHRNELERRIRNCSVYFQRNTTIILGI